MDTDADVSPLDNYYYKQAILWPLVSTFPTHIMILIMILEDI